MRMRVNVRCDVIAASIAVLARRSGTRVVVVETQIVQRNARWGYITVHLPIGATKCYCVTTYNGAGVARSGLRTAALGMPIAALTL